MTASVTRPEDILNIALAQIGFPRRIGDIYEGSMAAKMGLDIYSETRDEILRKQMPGFANGAIVLSLLKSAPAGGYSAGTPWTVANPPIPWLYEYGYPVDCLRILYVYSAQTAFPNYDPLPVLMKVANDPSQTPSRVILSQQPNAAMTYVKQVTDITQWDPLFTQTLTFALSRKLASIGKGQQFLEVLKANAELEANSEQVEQVSEET